MEWVLFWDWRSEFYAGLCKPCKYVGSVDMVEFNASLIGLHFALEARFHDVVLEGDNLMVIASLSNR